MAPISLVFLSFFFDVLTGERQPLTMGKIKEKNQSALLKHIIFRTSKPKTTSDKFISLFRTASFRSFVIASKNRTVRIDGSCCVVRRSFIVATSWLLFFFRSRLGRFSLAVFINIPAKQISLFSEKSPGAAVA